MSGWIQTCFRIRMSMTGSVVSSGTGENSEVRCQVARDASGQLNSLFNPFFKTGIRAI